jgi:hypothetical protein
MKSCKVVQPHHGAQLRKRAIMLSLVINATILLGSCGSGLPHSNEVIVTITPAQATVPVGQTIGLVGSATGFSDTRGVVARWWVQEAKDTGANDCGYLEPPPTSHCQYGYVTYGPIPTFPSSASYYAPQTPGTYHVTFEATQFSYGAFDHLTKTATATITVTP